LGLEQYSALFLSISSVSSASTPHRRKPLHSTSTTAIAMTKGKKGAKGRKLSSARAVA
jgi:hypothetical protein